MFAGNVWLSLTFGPVSTFCLSTPNELIGLELILNSVRSFAEGMAPKHETDVHEKKRTILLVEFERLDIEATTFLGQLRGLSALHISFLTTCFHCQPGPLSSKTFCSL